MTDYDHQLLAIRRALDRRNANLCRLGKRDEWVALGLPHSPTLRYCEGQWEGSDEALTSLINQAIGDLTHEHCNGDQDIQPRRSRHRRSA